GVPEKDQTVSGLQHWSLAKETRAWNLATSLDSRPKVWARPMATALRQEWRNTPNRWGSIPSNEEAFATGYRPLPHRRLSGPVRAPLGNTIPLQRGQTRTARRHYGAFSPPDPWPGPPRGLGTTAPPPSGDAPDPPRRRLHTPESLPHQLPPRPELRPPLGRVD